MGKTKTAQKQAVKKQNSLFTGSDKLIILFVIVGLAGAFFINRISSLPDPRSGKMIRLRDEVANVNSRELKEISSKESLIELGKAKHEKCYEGQNNFKIKDGYNNKCTIRTTNFYAYKGDFRELLISLEKKLNDMGWSSSQEGSINTVLTNYYDKNYYNQDPEFLSRHSGKYLITDMPSPGVYVKNKQELHINYAEKTEGGAYQLSLDQDITGAYYSEYDIKNFVNNNDILSWIKQNQYVITLSIQKDYFEN